MKDGFPRIVIPPEIRRKMKETAREFRQRPTPAERILWNASHGKKLDGVKLLRQQPIGHFVVDFCSSAYRLVVEVDGAVHESQKEADAARQEILKMLGLTVLRIKTQLMEQNLVKAPAQIRSSIDSMEANKYPITPSPLMGDGKGGGD